MPSRGSLVGIRQPADPGAGCAACGNEGAPALAYVPPVTARNQSRPVTRFCLPCVGVAVEAATGWKVLRAWSQGLASSLQAFENRGGLRPTITPTVKE